MTGYLLYGLCGLLLGMVLRWTGLSHPDGLRQALGLRRSYPLRSALTALGWGLVLTAALAWLAVLDVDGIAVMELQGGSLLGGALFGAAAGLCGYTPLTAFAGLGGPRRGRGGQALEALCVLAGCLAAVWLLPLAEAPLSRVTQLPPHSAATLFRITLDEPFLLDGGFLGHACLGLVLIAAAMCIPSPRLRMVDDAEIAARAAALPQPEAAPAETFVAVLPGEEPLVVDTALDAADDAPHPLEPGDKDTSGSPSPQDAPSPDMPMDLPPDIAHADGIPNPSTGDFPVLPTQDAPSPDMPMDLPPDIAHADGIPNPSTGDFPVLPTQDAASPQDAPSPDMPMDFPPDIAHADGIPNPATGDFPVLPTQDASSPQDAPSPEKPDTEKPAEP